MGNCQSSLSKADEDISQKLEVDSRTVQNWRKRVTKDDPRGVISKATFLKLWSTRFRALGDPELVFDFFDPKRKEELSFEAFMGMLCIVHRWPTDEQIKWTFQLYDLNQDGLLEVHELTKIAKNILNVAMPRNPSADIAELVKRIYAGAKKPMGESLSSEDFLNGTKDIDEVQMAYRLHQRLLEARP